MVEFEIRIHEKQGTAYFPKEIREVLGTEVKAVPNRTVVLFYPKNMPIKDVMRSLSIIKDDLQHCIDLEKKAKK